MGNVDSVQTHAKSEEFPYGNEFQIILIALAFREPKFIDLYEHILQPQFFDREEFRHIVRIITQYFSRYGRTPDAHLAYGVIRSYCMDKKFPESVVQLLENVLDKIFKADLENADFVKEEAIRFAQAQLMKETLLEGVKKIDDPSNYPELLKKFERVLEVAAPRDYGMKFNDIALDLPAQLREHSIFSLSRRVKTGIKSFDEHTFGGSAPKKLGVVMAPSGSGKRILFSTPVLTTSGWKTHGELVVGDEVFGLNGKPIRVIATGNIGSINCKLTFSNNSTIYCHEDHEWLLFDRTGSRRCWRILETKKLIETKIPSLGKGLLKLKPDLMRGERSRFQLPTIEALQFSEKKLPLHPYVLGVWLGDGTHTKACVTHDEKDFEMIDEIVRLGYPISSVQTHKTTGVKTTYFGGEFDKEKHFGVCGPLRKGLKESGVFGNKHIPDLYLQSSIEQRLQLLAGIIDTDGTFTKEGKVVISTVSEKLANGIVELVRSFGWRTKFTVVEPRTSTSGIIGKQQIFRIQFVPYLPVPTKLPRKKIEGSKFPKRRVGVVSSELGDFGFGNCIQVDSPDGIYLVGKELIPTHNSHLLVQFGATAIRNGQPVFHYTFGDMDMYEVFLRYASNFSGIPSGDIMHGTGRDYHTTMLSWIKENKQDLLVSTHPADTMTTAALRSHISMQISRTGIHPALIIIDYADNLAFNMQKKYGGFEHSMQLGEVYQQLIKLAHQFDCAIWTGSQVARDHWKDEVIDRDGIAASAKKIDHADYIITINRTEEERNFGTARLYEAKIRFGKDKHTIPVSFNTSTSRIEELDAPPTFLKKKEEQNRGLNGGKKQIKVDTTEEIEATDPNMERRLKILRKLNVDPTT